MSVIELNSHGMLLVLVMFSDVVLAAEKHTVQAAQEISCRATDITMTEKCLAFSFFLPDGGRKVRVYELVGLGAVLVREF